MNRLFLFIIFLLIPIGVLASPGTSTFVVDINVNNCNSNSVCEDAIGEDFLTCSIDCPATCILNGVCEATIGESDINCAQDCLTTPTTTTSTIPAVEVVSGGGGGGSVPPPYTVFNVMNLLARPGDANVVLSWEVLDNANYGGVLIRRSDYFSPITIADGGILYNGKGELLEGVVYSLKDLDLKNGHWYFYTVFLYDKQGKFSSGASVAALPQSEKMKEGLKELVVPPKKIPPELSIPKIVASTTVKFVNPIVINLTQNNKLVEFNINKIKTFILEPNVTTTVIINNDNVPAETVAITATVESNIGFQTLFLKKEDSGNYKLVIPATSLFNGGNLIFTFINKQKQALERVSGIISTTEEINKVSEEVPILTSPTSSFEWGIVKYFKSILNRFRDITMLMINLAILVIKLLKNWFYFIGVLVIHK